MKTQIPELISNAAFAKQIGRTPITIWRWQKLGWLGRSINIAGKPYLTRESLETFYARAKAGDFAQEPHLPTTPKSKGA